MRRHSGFVLLTAGLLVLAAAGGAARADEGGAFDGFELAAQSAGFEISYWNSEGTGGQGSVPEASADLATGPRGNALSSVAWPGPTVADMGTLVAFLSGVDEAGDLNYPVRAQASAPGGPPESETTAGPATMTAHAGDSLSRAEAHSAGTDVPGMLHAGTLISSAQTRVEIGRATAESSSEVHDIVLAGGAVKIGAVYSAALASSDGVDAATSARTVFTGVEVGGRPAVIDEQGIRFDDQRADKPGPPDPGFAAAGIEVRILEPKEVRHAAGASVTAGAATFTFAREGHVFNVTLGGATAQASAAATDAALLGDLADDTAGDDAVDEPETFDHQRGAGPTTQGASSGLLRTERLHRREDSPDTRLAGALPTAPLASYGGLPFAIVAGSVGAAALVAFGLVRLADRSLLPPVPSCGPGGDS